jgi:uncharacterized protein YukE
MTLIRVDPSNLRQRADQLEAAAARLQALADEALELAASAPSHDGEFGPKAQGLGSEAMGALAGRATQLSELSAQLRAKAQAFEQADLRGEEAFASLGFSIPPPGIPWPDWGDILPWWLVELVIGLFPFGDSYDILKQLGGLVTQGELDELVLLLSVLGLAADAGWLDGVIPDPVDAANAGLALLKGLVKQIPPGPVRDAIKETIVAMFKNADEGPRFFAALFQLVTHGEVLKVLKENPRAFAAVLEAGSESMEQLAKNEQVALAILKHEDVAVALFKNSQYLDEIIQGGPEAVEQLLKYGDDFAARFLDAIPENGLARLELLQGIEISKRAEDFGVQIHVAGRLADTPVEAEIRRLAAQELDELIEKGVPRLEAQLRVVEKYQMDVFQAKVPTHSGDIDLFIPEDQWRRLSDDQREELTEALADTFDVNPDKIDFYQSLEATPGYPDPATNIPPGSIQFNPDGSINHPELGNPVIRTRIEAEGGTGVP